MDRKFLNETLSSIEDETARKSIIDEIMKDYGITEAKHKTDLETIKNDLKVKDGVIDNLNAKIKEAGEIDLDTIKKEQFDLGKVEGSKEVETFKKSIALEKALANSKAKDVKLLEKLLNSEKLSYEEKEGNYTITGLDEQLKGIKSTHAYLFEEEKPNDPAINLGGNLNNPPKSNADTLMSALHEKYDK